MAAAAPEDDVPAAARGRRELPGASAGAAASRGSTPKRRRLRGKQAPPPEGLHGLYEVTKARVEHIEAFGAVYGKVWVARNRHGQRRWLKQVKSHSWQDGLPEHGVREVAILRDLASTGNMPHIMAVAHALVLRDAGSQCHKLIVVAQHASHDLVTYVKSRELSAAAVQAMSWQIALAVDFMHSRGVLHRNLKPASILVCADGRLVVSGFETAIRCPPDGARSHYGGFILRSHIAVRAPELILGLNCDHPGMDIWALGCCIAFLALGRSIFQPEDDTDEAACREIFHRLGKPGKDHVLAGLQYFPLYNIPWQEPLGLDLPRGLMGEDGARLIAQLLDLDFDQRITAREVLLHRYFAGFAPPRQLLLGACSSPEAPPPSGESCDDGGVSGNRRLITAVACGMASKHYLLRDLRRDRALQVWRVVALMALQQHLHRISGLCQHVWGFLARPRHPQPDYILGLTYIKEWMRAVLIDWLVEVHWKWRLQPAALILAVRLIDRYMAQTPALPTDQFQLLGVAALFFAAKVEDEHYDTDMSAQSLSWVTDRAYTAAEVLNMEATLACTVDFEAAAWGAYHFLCRYDNVAPLPRRFFFVAQGYMEQSLCIYRLSRLSPSLLACGCFYLAAGLMSAAAASADAAIEPSAAEARAPSAGDSPATLGSAGGDPGEASARPALRRPSEEEATGVAAMGGPRSAGSRRPLWPAALAEEAGRSEEEVRRCAAELAEAVASFEGRGSSGKPLEAVRTKFAREDHLKASDLIWPPDPAGSEVRG